MFLKAIWDKLPICIFESFEIARVKREKQFQIFEYHKGDLSQKSPKPNMGLLVNHVKPTSTLVDGLSYYRVYPKDQF